MKLTTKAFLLSLFALSFAACDDDDNDNDQDATQAGADGSADGAAGADGSVTDASIDGSVTDASIDGSVTDASIDGSTTDADIDGSTTDADIDGSISDGSISDGGEVSACQDKLSSVCGEICSLSSQDVSQLCSDETKWDKIQALTAAAQCQDLLSRDFGMNIACGVSCESVCANADICAEACGIDGSIKSNCLDKCTPENASEIASLISNRQCADLMTELVILGVTCDSTSCESVCANADICAEACGIDGSIKSDCMDKCTPENASEIASLISNRQCADLMTELVILGVSCGSTSCDDACADGNLHYCASSCGVSDIASTCTAQCNSSNVDRLTNHILSMQCSNVMDDLNVSGAQCPHSSACETACESIDQVCSNRCGIEGAMDECLTACSDNNASQISELIKTEKCSDLMSLLSISGATCRSPKCDEICTKDYLTVCAAACNATGESLTPQSCLNGCTDQNVDQLADYLDNNLCDNVIYTITGNIYKDIAPCSEVHVNDCQTICASAEVSYCAQQCESSNFTAICTAACNDANPHRRAMIQKYASERNCNELAGYMMTGCEP